MAEVPLDQAVARFKVNESNVDKLVNGLASEDAYTPTGGGPAVPSFQKLIVELRADAVVATDVAEAAAAIAQAAQRIYPTSTAGADDAAVPVNGYFYVLTADPNLFELWLKTAAGMATDTGRRYPSSAALTGVPAAVALANTNVEVITGLPSTYPSRIVGAYDTAGVLRVLESVSSAGQELSYRTVNPEQLAGITAGFAELDALGIAETIIGLPLTYPLRTLAMLDTAGSLRVLEQISGTTRRIFATVEGAGGAGGQVGSSVTPLAYDLFIATGQSNMGGRGDGPFTPVQSGVGFYYAFNTDQILPFAEPNIQISDATLGTLFSGFITEYHRRTGRGVIIVQSAEGGTPMQNFGAPSVGLYWDDGGTLTPRAISRAQNALIRAKALGYAVRFAGELFAQGEADAGGIDLGNGSTKQGYKDAFARHVASMRVAFGAQMPVFLFRLGRLNTGETTGYTQIRDAHDELVAGSGTPSINRIVMTSTIAVNFTIANGGMRDVVHWSQRGLNDIGAYGAVTISAAL